MTGLAFPKQVIVRDRAHLARVRALGCCVPRCPHGWASFRDPCYREYAERFIHAHHIRIDAGTGIKPSDSQVIGLCAPHHHEGHQRGWRTFEREYGIDLYAISKTLWAETLDIRSKQQ